jgi:class 3 adenylate cyclase
MSEPGSSAAWLEDEQGRRIALAGDVSVGRAAGNEVVVNDERVSRTHALVHAQGTGEFWLVDLGSRNGTYLRGKRAFQPTRLQDGDAVEIGPARFTFHQGSGRSRNATQGQGASKTIVETRMTDCWLLVADIVGSTRLGQARPADQVSVVFGEWLARCKTIIDAEGGGIDKFLGDGFLAYWRDHERSAAAVVRALRALSELQAAAQPRFRLVLHYGRVLVGAMAALGHEDLFGPEISFVFRMEKLAASLDELRLASEPAVRRLGPILTSEDMGSHALPSFEGRHRFWRF